MCDLQNNRGTRSPIQQRGSQLLAAAGSGPSSSCFQRQDFSRAPCWPRSLQRKQILCSVEGPSQAEAWGSLSSSPPGDYRKTGKFLANSLWQENGDLSQQRSGQLCDPWTGKGTSLSLRFPICELGWGRCLSQTKCAEGVCLLRNASGLLEPPIPSPSPSGA